MIKIRYSDEFICPKCGRHTALVCRTDGTHQAHCMICDVYYDVEIAKTTNADRIRAMTDDDLAKFLVSTMTCTACQDMHGGKCPKPKDYKVKKCRDMILGWLKRPVEEVQK